MSENIVNKTVENSGRATTKDLKRVLGFWDLMSTSVGQIIGAGIMSLTGVAIAMTGRSTPIAFILAAVFVIAFSIPQIFIYATARFRGGQYTVITALIGPKIGGFFIIIFILTNLSIAMYALSFADYALAFIPLFGRKLIAITILTLFYILNFFGVDKMAKIQNIIVIVLILSLSAFVFFGIAKIDTNYFADSFMPNGILGILTAASLLTFATGGATVVANLAGEAKNPVRDVPLVIIISTIGVAIIYGFVATIAAGVLPVAQVANQPLTWVAAEILPGFLYVIFVVGGAMFALISTLNAQLAWATKPVLQACVDGWFPKSWAYLHPKYKTPVALLTGFYLIGLFPIIFNFDIGVIGSYVVIISQIMTLLLTYSAMRLSVVMPELWNKSKFKVSKSVMMMFLVLAWAVSLAQIYFLIGSWTLPVIIGNVVILILAAVYSIKRYSSGKVDMEVSYEEV